MPPQRRLHVEDGDDDEVDDDEEEDDEEEDEDEEEDQDDDEGYGRKPQRLVSQRHWR